MDRKPLTIELIPQTAWGQNLRAVLSSRDWDAIRRFAYKRAGYRCECCGGVGPRHPVECHEVWDWDTTHMMQWLVDVVALCPTCHSVKHWGRTMAVSTDPEATQLALLKHIARTNDWDAGTTYAHLDAMFMRWQIYSQVKWTLDVHYFLTYSEAAESKAFVLQDYKGVPNDDHPHP